MPAIATRAVDSRALLACGVIATVFYAAGDLVGGLHWQGYSFRDTSISELSAIGSPSRALVTPLFFVYTLCTIVFGVGVLSIARTRAMRVTAALILAIGLVDVAGPAVPMHLRGMAGSLTDVMHIAVTSVTVALILGAIIAGGIAIRGWFRVYSIITLAVVLAGGALAGLQGGSLAAGAPTPWLGALERVNVHGAMVWYAALAVVLLRSGELSEPRLAS